MRISSPRLQEKQMVILWPASRLLRPPAKPLLTTRLIPCTSSRCYHSLERSRPSSGTETESAILTAALTHVSTHGFTTRSLQLGARDAGYLPISTNLFPTGPFSLVNHHLITQRFALSTHFQRPPISPATNDAPKDISDRIRWIAIQRLLANEPYIAQWQSALALLSLPANLPNGLKELARLADEILYLAGSTTVTTAWYTDRAALASIYAGAELYMTQDRSKGFEGTKDFLTRRLDEGDRLRKSGSMVGQWVGMQLGGVVNGLRSKGVWI